LSEHDAITVEDLTDEELQLLIGLLMVAVHADLEYSEEEADGLIKVGDRVGRERFVAASAALRQRLPNQEDILAAIPTVERVAARALIYQMVKEICSVDGVVEREKQLLRKLANAWGLTSV
jgi:hypothetical protein